MYVYYDRHDLSFLFFFSLVVCSFVRVCIRTLGTIIEAGSALFGVRVYIGAFSFLSVCVVFFFLCFFFSFHSLL
ncbi:hypothetical protein STCU_11290 [Strigomonas culicis]|uniref:Uncharacterized protein n=1 Tax=Strigomonas culicis TaxID=28005 RepID=S9V0T4_9TRYP|nr:hypothetical protein STCU_11290 [Strigomonas culicis]|eukprot:EPY16425.1 hypothetical protein STCU_11290 [Strigomonas culicis]